MNNIRKIITERLENASLDYRYWLSVVGFDGIIEPDFYKLEGQIEAYQDCLNLMQPRTEQDLERLEALEKENEKLKKAIEIFKSYLSVSSEVDFDTFIVSNYDDDVFDLLREVIKNE